jgi:hypothetical protein
MAKLYFLSGYQENYIFHSPARLCSVINNECRFVYVLLIHRLFFMGLMLPKIDRYGASASLAMAKLVVPLQNNRADCGAGFQPAAAFQAAFQGDAHYLLISDRTQVSK